MAAALQHFPSQAAKYLPRLDKPGMIGLRILVGNHPELPKKPLKPTPKKVGKPWPVPRNSKGVAYILRRHTETADRKCSTLHGKQVSPHVLRHTCAMIVLQATQDIRKVSLWLGHSSLTTTEVYVRADP